MSAIETFVSLAQRYLERGDIEQAKEVLNQCESSIEDAKEKIHDFRVGNITFK